MNVKTFEVNGAIVFWSVGPTRRDLLRQRLTDLGLERYEPAERTDDSALLNALSDYCRGENARLKREDRDKIVQRRQTRKDGFEIVDVERQKRQNHYTSDFGAKAEDGRVCVDNSYSGLSLQERLQELFDQQKATLTGASVGKALVELLSDLGAVCLRDAGGVYWLSEEALDEWAKAAEAVEESALARGKNQVQMCNLVRNDHSCKAIRDGITQEIQTVAAALAEEITGCTLGEDAMRSRIEQAHKLHDRITAIEESLGETLGNLHAVASTVEQAATLATLQTVGV